MLHTKLTESNEPDPRADKTVFISGPGKTLLVPLEKLQGLRPGQSIPMDEEGYFLVKMGTGRYKVFKDVTSTDTQTIGKTPLLVPQEKLKGLRPGQSIPTDEEGYFLAKMGTGRYKAFKDVTSTETHTIGIHTGPPWPEFEIPSPPPSGSKEFEIPAPSDDAQSESDSDSDSDSG